MTFFQVNSPFEVFTDANGDPLESGFIYVGEAYKNPIVSPENVFWDRSGAYPAAQPIRTVSGYPSRNGTASILYINPVADRYSIIVKDKNESTVFYNQAVESFSIALSTMDIRLFGASPDNSAADNTTAIQAAIDYAATVSENTSVATVDMVTTALTGSGVFEINELELKNGVTIQGGSRTSLVFKHSGVSNAFTMDKVNYKHNICLKNLTLIGDSTDSLYGIDGWGMIRSCIIEDVLFDGFTDAVHLSNCWTIQLNNCQCQNQSRYNIYGDGLTNGQILGGRYDDAGSHSCYIENASINTESLLFQGAAFQFSQGGGIVLDNIKNAIIDGCFFEGLCKDGSSTYAYVHADLDSSGTVEITNNYINKGGTGLDGKAAVFIDGVKAFVYSGNQAQSQAVGLHIGSTAEAGTVLDSILANPTPYINDSSGAIIIKEGNQAPLFLGPDMNDGSFDFDKASGVFGDWNSGSPRYVAVGLWSSIPAIQGAGSGTSNRLRINPHAGRVEIAYGIAQTWLGQSVRSSTLTGSNATTNDIRYFYGVDCSGGNRSVALNTTHTTGTEVVIGKRDGSANILTINPASGLIDGGASLVLSGAYETCKLISDGTNWLRMT